MLFRSDTDWRRSVVDFVYTIEARCDLHVGARFKREVHSSSEVGGVLREALTLDPELLVV